MLDVVCKVTAWVVCVCVLPTCIHERPHNHTQHTPDHPQQAARTTSPQPATPWGATRPSGGSSSTSTATSRTKRFGYGFGYGLMDIAVVAG